MCTRDLVRNVIGNIEMFTSEPLKDSLGKYKNAIKS